MLETEQERKKMTEIYEEHRHALMMYAFKITGNQEMAEDAVHNTFISIIKQKEKYFNLSGSDFRFSSVSIVKNKCIDLLRKQNFFENVPFEEAEFFIESAERSVEEQVIASSEYEAMRGHLKSIDEISRQVLVMKYYLGLSYKEIGEELGMTTKHVETRISRAKSKVRKLVKSEVSR